MGSRRSLRASQPGASGMNGIHRKSSLPEANANRAGDESVSTLFLKYRYIYANRRERAWHMHRTPQPVESAPSAVSNVSGFWIANGGGMSPVLRIYPP